MTVDYIVEEWKANNWKLFSADGRINKKFLFAMLSVLCMAGYLGIKNFLLFHSLTEILTILVSFSIALIVLNTHQNLRRDFISVIGIAYAFAGVFDILHTLSYRGMGVLPDDSANLPTQMWIIARYLDSIGMLVAGVSFYRIIKPLYVLIAYAAISGLTLLAVFHWGIFPTCFIEGQGLTIFKIYSEYIICLILMTSVFILMRHKNLFQLHEYYPLLFFFLVSIFTELSFTIYKHVGRWDSIIGHLFKTVAFFFLYHAVVVTNLHEPYNRVRSQARLLDLAHDYIMVRGLDNRILYWNHGAEVGYGWAASEVQGQVVYSLLQTEFSQSVEHVMATLLTKGHWEGEVVNTRKNGEQIRVMSYQTLNPDAMGRPESILEINHDITEKRRQEEAILAFKEAQAKVEKLASIGTMAAGICHEINQPLNSIKVISSAFTYSYKEGFKRSIEEFVGGMEQISNQVDRISNTIAHLRSFVHRDDSLLVSCDINAAIIGSLELVCEQIAAHGITVQKHLGENLPEILAFPTALEEVMINLLINSMQALDTVKNLDKRIIIRTYFDDGVVAEISDNGPGVDPQLDQKIFEPFVSTKSGGGSLGLGLTIVSSIVTSCYGTIQLVSKGNSGAAFRIRFQPHTGSDNKL